MGQICVEIPAGLAGDSGAPESWKAAALRELREETGYTAADMDFLAREIASLRMRDGDLAPRDFIRSELREFLEDLEERQDENQYRDEAEETL